MAKFSIKDTSKSIPPNFGINGDEFMRLATVFSQALMPIYSALDQVDNRGFLLELGKMLIHSGTVIFTNELSKEEAAAMLSLFMTAAARGDYECKELVLH